MAYRFRKPVAADAEMLLDWRTRPEITRFMFTDIVPDLDRQRAWLEQAGRREDFRHFIVCRDDTPIGYLSFTDIDWRNRRCSSGSYLADRSEHAKIGALWTWYIHDYCFYVLNMNKLVNYFMDGNRRIVAGQKINGFREVGVHREHVLKDGKYHDVHVFELLKADWDNFQRRPVSREQTLAAFEG